jgi:uncharacterized phage-associated protein
MTRFTVNWDKAIEAIDFIASRKPGVTQYYIGKILFFADREHLLDFGRPITGDRYVAMEHGPVPSAIRDILKADSDFPDEILTRLHERVVIEHEGNKQKVFSKSIEAPSRLSGSDKSYLEEATSQYGSMTFTELKKVSHEDRAYVDAWERLGNANEMNIDLWLQSLDDPEAARAQVSEYASCGR